MTGDGDIAELWDEVAWLRYAAGHDDGAERAWANARIAKWAEEVAARSSSLVLGRGPQAGR